jgi:hypothetical protein
LVAEEVADVTSNVVVCQVQSIEVWGGSEVSQLAAQFVVLQSDGGK